MARITLSAAAFADFGVAEPGEIITLGWPGPGEELVLPRRGWRFPPGSPEQHWRNYTVRRRDPARAEVDVDFALHDDPGQATRWAAGARPGDRAGFAGPRTHWQRDRDADWSLLAADDTGVPAALAILESLPEGHRAIALLEVADDRECQPVQTPADVDVRWLSRDGRPPGTTTLLPDALREVELPPGAGQVWGAGESRAMRRVRDHVRRSRGIAKEAVSVLGYWAVSRSSNGTSSSTA
jgi:NADPH-dependent ferric siderophore reductase